MNQLIRELLEVEYDYEECYYFVKKWKKIINKQIEKKEFKYITQNDPNKTGIMNF